MLKFIDMEYCRNHFQPERGMGGHPQLVLQRRGPPGALQQVQHGPLNEGGVGVGNRIGPVEYFFSFSREKLDWALRRRRKIGNGVVVIGWSVGAHFPGVVKQVASAKST